MNHPPSDAAQSPVRSLALAGRPAFLTTMVSFVLLAGVLPASVTQWHDSYISGTTLALIWAATAWSAWRISAVIFRSCGDLTLLAFHIFVYVFMGISVLAQATHGEFPGYTTSAYIYSDSGIQSTYLYIIVGIVAFESAWLIANAWTGRRATRQYTALRLRWLDPARLYLLGAVGILFTLVLVARTGIGPFFDSRQAAANAVFGQSLDAISYQAASKSQGALLRYFAQVPSLLALVGILYSRRQRRQRPVSRAADVLVHVEVALLVVANVLVNNPVANSRFWFSIVAIGIAAIWVPFDKPRAMRWSAIVAIVVLLFGFVPAQAFRRNGGAVDYSQGFQADLTGSPTYSAFVMTMIGHRWVTVNGHTDGQQLAGSVGIPIPRSLWPSKPIDTGNLILPVGNPAAPLWTEAQVDFGVVGVVLFFGVLGFVSRFLDEKLRRGPPGTVWKLAVPVCAGLMIFVLRGSLQSALGPTYVIAVCLALVSRRQNVKINRSNVQHDVVGASMLDGARQVGRVSRTG